MNERFAYCEFVQVPFNTVPGEQTNIIVDRISWHPGIAGTRFHFGPKAVLVFAYRKSFFKFPGIPNKSPIGHPSLAVFRCKLVSTIGRMSVVVLINDVLKLERVSQRSALDAFRRYDLFFKRTRKNNFEYNTYAKMANEQNCVCPSDRKQS